MSDYISIVIPTHNRADGLRRALDSVSKQSLNRYEVIVVDDGSHPPVNHNVFSCFPDNIKCQLLRNDTPQGANNARNKAVRNATGNYIAFLDDDDEFIDNKVEVLTGFWKAEPSVDIFYHPARINMVNEGVSYISKPEIFFPDDNPLPRLLIKNCIGGTPMVACKKDAIIECGLFDESLPARQDYDLWIRMAQAGKLFYYIDEPLTNYAHNSKNDSITKSLDKVVLARKIMQDKYKKEYAELGKACRLELLASDMRSDITRLHLSGRSLQACRYSWHAFIRTGKFLFLASAVISLLGSRLFIMLRSKTY